MLVNKTAAPVDFELRVEGFPGLKLAVADAPPGPGDRLALPAGADEVRVYRVLLTAPPGQMTGTSRNIDFMLRDPADRSSTRYHTTFRGP